MKRIVFFLLAFVFVLAFSFAGGQNEAAKKPSVEEAYPSKPVKVIIPWGAGGGTDMMMRGMLTVMSSYFPQPMIIIDQPGGGGTIGTTEALMAEPDGYTILVTGIGPMVTQPFLKDVQYTENDYEVVLQLSDIPRILCAHPSTTYNTSGEMMDYARKNPEKIKVGVAAIGTTGHLGMVQIEMEQNVKFTMVPQGGGGPQKVALLGGHVDVAPLTASEAGPLVSSGQVKALGVMDTKRFAELPDIPTCEEQGVPIRSGVSWHVYVPAGTPPDRIKVLHDAFNNCLEDEVFKKVAVKLNIGVEYKDGQAAAQDIKMFRELYSNLIGKLGLKK